MPITINGKTFQTFEDAVNWVKQNRPEISNPEAFVAEIEKRQSQGNLVTQDKVLKPDPGGLQPVKGKFKKEKGIFAGAAVELFQKDGKNFLRVFLLNTEINKNFWHVTPESIPRFAMTFIGMPFIDDKGNNPQNDGKKRHFGAENLPLDQILTRQEDFRVGNIIDVETRKVNGEPELYAIVEITNQKIFDDINNGKDIFVSPAITGRPIKLPCGSLLYDQWHGLHLARVTDPAYGVMRASIKQTCQGTERQCVQSLISSAAMINTSFTPLNDSQNNKMTEFNNSTAVFASEDELKKLKEENASLTKQLASAQQTVDELEKKEKQNSQIANDLTSQLADIKAKLAAEEEEDKKELASKIAQIEKEDEVEDAATQEELMKLNKEELARKLASANSYHTKLASLKSNSASQGVKVVRMAKTASIASLRKERENGKPLSLRTVMEAMS